MMLFVHKVGIDVLKHNDANGQTHGFRYRRMLSSRKVEDFLHS